MQAVPPGIFLSVSANKPIQAVFFASGQDGSDVISRPASMLLAPEPQWSHQYWFTTLTDDLTGFYETYALIVANQDDVLGITIDDIPVSTCAFLF